MKRWKFQCTAHVAVLKTLALTPTTNYSSIEFVIIKLTEMFGHKEPNHLISEIAPMALFVFMANLAKKLNITPKEFGEMLDDIKGAQVYLEELMLAKMQAKIDERKNSTK